jgi:hypothetical protein
MVTLVTLVGQFLCLETEERNELLAQTGKSLKLNDIYPALARFTLQHKRLKAMELHRYLDLRQSGFLAHLSKSL